MGTPELSWRDVWTIAASCGMGSRLAGEIDPRASWTTQDYLLAHIADAARLGVWVQGSGKRRNKPQPLPRPGDKRADRFEDVEPMPVDDLKAFLARPRH